MSKIQATKKDFEIAERLKEIRIALFGERGQTRMARLLGISQPAYFRYENAQVRLQNKALALLAERQSVNPLYLLTGRGDKYIRPKAPIIKEEEEEYGKIQSVPVLSDEIAAGPPRAIEDYPSEEFFAFRARWLHHPKDTFALKVRGDSMEPEIANGSWVLVDVRDRDLRPGVIYAVRAEGGCVVRRLFVNGDVLNFFPLRPSQENKIFYFKRPAVTPIIGRVIWVFRKL